MKTAARIFLTVFLISTAGIAWAADKYIPSTDVSVDRYEILIGDRIKYTVAVDSRHGLDISLPKFEDKKIGDFEIKDSKTSIKKSIFGNYSYRYVYFITTYSVGKHIIPQLEIKYKTKAEKDWQALKTKQVVITVQSVIPKGAKPADIKDIKGPLYFREINWFLLVSFLVCCTIIFFIYTKFFKKRRPVKLAHETALEELESIRTAFAQTGNVKEYYIAISDCVRIYIERRFKLKAPEMTTEEFLNLMRDSSALPQGQKELLKNFMAACDMVKFAKYLPHGEESEAVYNTAKNFVEETKESAG